MNKETVLKMLWMLQHNLDTEMSHIAADRILCKFLTFLGHSDVVEEYFKIEKWYA